MRAQPESRHVLSFARAAFERCFVVAEVLEERYGERFLEYGMLGLASEEDPLHVLATPLLPGQEVTCSSVFQSGHQVIRMRSEIEAISGRLGQPLVPVCFVHRHPGSCEPSGTDREFVARVFINHVATMVMFTERRDIDPASRTWRHTGREPSRWDAARAGTKGTPVEVAYALAFSLIVNKKREYAIFVARKEWIPGTDDPQVRFLPAEVRLDADGPLSAQEMKRLRRGLEVEIEEKMKFPEPAVQGS